MGLTVLMLSYLVAISLGIAIGRGFTKYWIKKKAKENLQRRRELLDSLETLLKKIHTDQIVDEEKYDLLKKLGH